MTRRLTAAAVSVVALFGVTGTLAAGPALAKRPKCVAQAVPDQPGTYVVTCSTNRP